MNTEEWRRFALALTDVTLWATGQRAMQPSITDADDNRRVAWLMLGAPGMEALRPYAELVLNDATIAGNAAVAELAASVILFGALLPRWVPAWGEAHAGEFEAGQVGHQAQVGKSYARRFVAPIGLGEWAVVTIAFYARKTSDGAVLVRRDEYVICRDPADVERTRTRLDARHWDLGPTDDGDSDAFDNAADFPIGAVVIPESVIRPVWRQAA